MEQSLFSSAASTGKRLCKPVLKSLIGAVSLLLLSLSVQTLAQLTWVDPDLSVRTNVTGLAAPTTMAFLGNNDMLVLEKETGKVQRVINGVIQATPALDLAVNFGSERGLLGIALHPDFPDEPAVYLYWTES